MKNPTKTVVTIGEISTVETTHEVHLEKGRNRIRLEVPSQYVTSSLRVLSEDLKLCKAISPPSDLEWRIDEFKTLINTEVRVTSAANLALAIQGILTDVMEDGSIILKDAEGFSTKLSLLNDSLIFSLTIPLKGERKGLDTIIHAPAAGKYSLRLLYQTRGLSCNPTLTAIYDGASVITKLNLTASISNTSGLGFKGAQVRLQPGNMIDDNDGVQPHAFRASSKSRMESASDDSGDASVTSVGEQKMYEFPESMDVPNGQPLQVDVLSVRTVPVRKEFYVPAQESWNRQEQSEPQPVDVRLWLNSDSENTLDVSLPACRVEIIENDDKGNASIAFVSYMEALAAGEKRALDLGQSTDVKFLRRLEDAKENLEISEGKMVTEERWSVTIFNHSEEKDATVRVEEKFERKFTITDRGPKDRGLQEDGATRAHIEISTPVKAGKKPAERTAYFTVQIDEPMEK
jgi:hypothetical protein